MKKFDKKTSFCVIYGGVNCSTFAGCNNNRPALAGLYLSGRFLFLSVLFHCQCPRKVIKFPIIEDIRGRMRMR